jgi:putative phosphoesterase
MPNNMKKLIITADIHSNLEAFEKLPAGKVICCGDLVGYGADPNQVVDSITGADWTCVMGNHDWAALTKETTGMNSFGKESTLWTFNQISPKSRKFLAGLPRTKILEIEGKSILVVHASPRDALHEYLFNPETVKMILKAIPQDILIFGHTHLPMVIREGDKLALNPGSVGQPRDDNPRASYAILRFPSLDVKIERKEYDIEKAANKIMSAGLPPILAERLYGGW